MSISDDKSVVVMAPNLMINEPQLKSQIDALGLRLGETAGFAWLGGDSKQIAKFLTGITADQLMPLGTCSSV
jgi:hypothetical protein